MPNLYRNIAVTDRPGKRTSSSPRSGTGRLTPSSLDLREGRLEARPPGGNSKSLSSVPRDIGRRARECGRHGCALRGRMRACLSQTTCASCERYSIACCARWRGASWTLRLPGEGLCFGVSREHARRSNSSRPRPRDRDRRSGRLIGPRHAKRPSQNASGGNRPEAPFRSHYRIHASEPSYRRGPRSLPTNNVRGAPSCSDIWATTTPGGSLSTSLRTYG